MARELSVVVMQDMPGNAFQLSPPEVLDSPGNGEWILIPYNRNGQREAAVTLSGTASWSGRVEGTNSPVSDVRDDTAVAVAWPDGTVNAATNRILFTFTAIRQVNITGTTRLEVNA